MHKILIVDDDPEIMDWLKLDLELSGFLVEGATDGFSGLKKALNEDYSLILLDVMMPKMDGFEVCQTIRKSFKDTPIILLTAKGKLEDKVKGFNVGADDYLVKPFDIQELLVRIRALLRRAKEVKISKDVTEAGEIKLLTDSLEVLVHGKVKKLTPTEFEILYYLMQNIDKAVSLQALLKEVWGYDSDDDVRIVRVHVGGLRQKIENDPKKPIYLQTITNVGYRLHPFMES